MTFQRISPHSRSILITAVFTIAFSIQGAPIPAARQKNTEIDQKTVESYGKHGGRIGYFGLPETPKGILSFQYYKPEVELSGIQGFKWTAKPDEGFGKLPQIEVPFGIDLSGLEISDLDVKELLHLKNLTILNLTNSKLNREALVEIAKINKLVGLNLSQNPLSDEEFKLLSPLSRLEWLQLDGTGISDKSMKVLAGFKNLAFLSMTGSKVSESGLRELRNLKNLQTLCIDEEKITDAFLKDMNQAGTLQALTQFTTLDGRSPKSRDEVERVTLQRSAISNEGLKELCAFKNVKSLFLNSPRVSDEGLKEIGKLEKLIEIGLTGASLTGNGFKELTQCKNLNRIYLDQNQLTDDMMHRLKKTGLLHKLMQFAAVGGERPKNSGDVCHANLLGTRITEAGLRDLAEFKHLNYLMLDESELNASSFRVLNSIGLLHSLVFACNESGNRPTSNDDVCSLDAGGARRDPSTPEGVSLSSAALEELTAFKNLTKISIACGTFDESFVAAVSKFAKLQDLTIQCDHMSARAAACLAEVRDRKSLHLNFPLINDDTFSALLKSKLLLKLPCVMENDVVPASIEDVTTIDFTNARITDATIKELVVFKKLKWLVLESTPIKGLEFKKLAELKHLTSIDLKQSAVTLEGLKQLKELRTLKQIHLNDAPVLNEPTSQKELEALEKALPECQIEKK